MSPNQPLYKGRPIASVEALGRALALDPDRLGRIAASADRYYLPRIWIRKPGRKPRPVHPAGPALRDIHQRILDRILKQVVLPDYLMGGITGRSYIGNARTHAASKVLLGQDVDSFYPSISVSHVEHIFQDVLHFPAQVATLLARLCTRKGELVQGGVASTHIANLALYRTEPKLFEATRRHGFRYTRFVDDVHLSSRRWLPSSVKTRMVSAMRGMLIQHGYRPKRKKQFVATPSNAMKVHGLNVNSSASSPSQRRQLLRNEIFLLERWVGMQDWDAAIDRTYLRLSTKVGQLKQLNPGEARRLRRRLDTLVQVRNKYAGGSRIPDARGEQ